MANLDVFQRQLNALSLILLGLPIVAFAQAGEPIDCSKPMDAKWPKANIVLDRGQLAGVPKVDIQIGVSVRSNDGSVESITVPGMQGSDIVAVPLLGKTSTDANGVYADIKIQKLIQWHPKGSFTPIALEITTQDWIKNYKENICATPGFKMVDLSLAISDELVNKIAQLVRLQIQYTVENKSVQIMLKDMTAGNAVTSLLAPEDAKSLSLKYRVYYKSTDGKVEDTGLKEIETIISENSAVLNIQ